ncbi:VOC family protein [Paenibacillus sp. B1-33]|uniref:VOC family protein n=1 Tax=unclassified Paenibacillus TaxID=185978 RepID=UPI003D2BACCE
MRIAEITLQTDRLHEMKQFYSVVLEFPIEEETTESFTVQAGQSRLIFQQSFSSKGFYHFAFTIPANQLEEAGQWVQRKGISLYTKDIKNQYFFEDWNATASYFYDPQGNLVEFIAHHALQNAAQSPFGAHSMIRISEIGLPLYQFEKGLARICEDFSLQVWRGDGKQFAGVGDEEGLFILIDMTRPWFPDGRMPVVAPVKVVIEGKANHFVELSGLPYHLGSATVH